MHTEIRPCTDTDVDVISVVAAYCFEDTFRTSCTREDMIAFLRQAYSHDILAQEFANTNSHFFILYVEHSIAGYLKVNFKDAQSEHMGPNMMEIERLYILPQYKGMGLGSTLMQFALDYAHQHEVAGVWLGVWEHNEPAKAFYTKHGFHFVGSHTFTVGSDDQTDLLMRQDW